MSVHSQDSDEVTAITDPQQQPENTVSMENPATETTEPVSHSTRKPFTFMEKRFKAPAVDIFGKILAPGRIGESTSDSQIFKMAPRTIDSLRTSSSNTILAPSNVPSHSFKRLRTSSFDEIPDVQNTILDIVCDMSKLVQEIHVVLFQNNDFVNKQANALKSLSVLQMEGVQPQASTPGRSPFAQAKHRSDHAGIGRGKPPYSPRDSNDSRSLGVIRYPNTLYTGSPYVETDYGHPLAFPIINWHDPGSLPIHKPPAQNPSFEEHPGMVQLPGSFQPKEVVVPTKAHDTFHRAQKNWETCRSMLSHCAHLVEAKINGTDPAWIYGIHPVPGYIPHDSPLWDPLIDLLVRQSQDIRDCVVDILYKQARTSHDQFIGELRSLEYLLGNDEDLQAGTRMKLAQYGNTSQRKRLAEHHKHILEGPALKDVQVELRRRMISSSYRGHLLPNQGAQALPLQPRQPASANQNQPPNASGNNDRGRQRDSAKSRLGKRQANSQERRDKPQQKGKPTTQGPLDRQSVTTRELAMIAHMRTYDSTNQ